ncbi:hypothetical protein K470DRAFT_255433, partial [Piedraia hortae CBS 480.64]
MTVYWSDENPEAVRKALRALHWAVTFECPDSGSMQESGASHNRVRQAGNLTSRNLVV